MSHSAELLKLIVFSILLSLSSSVEQCTLRRPVIRDECHKEGRIPRDQDYGSEPLRTNSARECALQCSRRSYSGFFGADCSSFSFDTKNHFCKLSSYQVVGPNNPMDPANYTATYFYDRFCFVCPDPCKSQPFDKQLIDNGEFEEELLGPWLSYRGRIARPGYVSRQAWQCADKLPKNGFNFSCGLYQSYKTCSNHTYLIQFDYKIPKGKLRSHKNFVLDIPEAYYFYFPSVAGDWKTVRFFVTNNDVYNPPETLYFSSEDDSSNFLIDNVHVSRSAVDTFTPAASNSLENGDFETGSLSPWQFTPKKNVTATIYTPGLFGSKYALKIEGDGYHIRKVGQPQHYVTQNFNTTPGATYLVKFYFGRDYEGSEMQLIWRSGNYSLRAAAPLLFQSTRNVLAYFVAYAAQSTIGLALDSDFDHIIIDNVTATELREPVSGDNGINSSG